jgi:hypothetical protein
MIEEEDEGAEYDEEEEVEDYGGEEFNFRNIPAGINNNNNINNNIDNDNLCENLMMASIKITDNSIKMKQ